MIVDPTPGDGSPTTLATEPPLVIQHHPDELDADLVEVVAAEQLLLTTTTTGDVEQIDRLLHPEFVEIGASGSTWDRSDIIRLLAAKPGSAGAADHFCPVRVGPDAVLLTYRVAGEPSTLRSSVWLRDASSTWRLRFHQGTHAPS